MLKVEYLIFIDNQSIKSSDAKTFNHLLQSDPDILINKDKMTFKGLTVDYIIKSGNVKNTNNKYFHLSFNCNSIDYIDDYNKLLKAIRSVLHLTNKTPQTLYDGVSLHYAQLAYPQVFEIENLMRKLITKFMLTNVGIDWINDRVPYDVKTSINIENKDLTYLHNVDFIQLKNFLFSENYPTHKENLFQKLKKAKDISELNLEDIKGLIPNSNWDRYFFDKVNISKEQLNNKWNELYELRCRIAHNKSFSKSDYENVLKLCSELKTVITNAIENLNKIDISENEREILTEVIAGNFNASFGEFISYWRELQKEVIAIIRSKVLPTKPDMRLKRTFIGDVTELYKLGYLDKNLFFKIRQLTDVRNNVVHNTDTLTHEEITGNISDIKDVILELKSMSM